MRHLIFCSGLVTLGVVFLHFSAAAQTTDTTSVPMRLVEGSPLSCKSLLNSNGPYDFVVDTGSNITARAKSAPFPTLDSHQAKSSLFTLRRVLAHQRRKRPPRASALVELTVLRVEIDALESEQLRHKPSTSFCAFSGKTSSSTSTFFSIMRGKHSFLIEPRVWPNLSMGNNCLFPAYRQL